MILKQGTEVLIYKKSAGRSFRDVMSGKSMKNMSIPLKGYILKHIKKDMYSIAYRKDQGYGGDFYLRGDFEVDSGVSLDFKIEEYFEV
jgi:hypothetical protein